MTLALAAAVERFATLLAPMDDAALERQLSEPAPDDDRWAAYFDYPRDVSFSAYQELRELAVDIAVARSAAIPPTTAQRILGQHQAAYRDLTGALVGIGDAELDLAPAEGEWSLRQVAEHMLRAEFGFSLVIESALEQRGAPEIRPAQFGAEEAMERSAGKINFTGDLATIRASFAAVHDHILESFAGLTDDDLALPSIWWEGRLTPNRFRMQRFDAHLREHTIQIDKTIVGIGHVVTEGERLARLLHRALGECEAVALGAPETANDRQRTVESHFTAWSGLLEMARDVPMPAHVETDVLENGA